MTATSPSQPQTATSCADCGRAILPGAADSLHIGADHSMAYSLCLDYTEYLCLDCAAAAGFSPDAGQNSQTAWLKQTIHCQICGQAFPRPWLYQPNCVECQSTLEARHAAREAKHQSIHQQEQSQCPLTQPSHFGPCSVIHQLLEAEFSKATPVTV